jgi:hypothetical protein
LTSADKGKFMKRLLSLGLVLLTLGLTGCDKTAESKNNKDQKLDVKKDDHDHDHGPGPHQGTIIELNNPKYHAEFCVDHGKKEVTVYILDGKAKDPAPIKATKMTLSITSPEFEVELIAKPLDTDPKDSCSRFTVVNEKFGKEQEFAGEVRTTLDGKVLRGKFKEEPHEHEKKK